MKPTLMNVREMFVSMEGAKTSHQAISAIVPILDIAVCVRMNHFIHSVLVCVLFLCVCVSCFLVCVSCFLVCVSCFLVCVACFLVCVSCFLTSPLSTFLLSCVCVCLVSLPHHFLHSSFLVCVCVCVCICVSLSVCLSVCLSLSLSLSLSACLSLSLCLSLFVYYLSCLNINQVCSYCFLFSFFSIFHLFSSLARTSC